MDPLPSAPRNEELLVHGRFLRGLARALVSDSERAEDLLQETWATALQHPPRHGAAPRAWLARILRRLAIRGGVREDEREGRERLAVREQAEPARGPAAIAAEIELSRQVFEAVERIREPYRSTLYLRYYRDLAPQRIAEELGVPPKTVKTRLSRGLELLREDLDRRHGGRREAWVALLLPLARSVPIPVAPGAPTGPLPHFFGVPLGVPLALGVAVAGLLVLTLTLRDGEGRDAVAPRAVAPGLLDKPVPAVLRGETENARTPLRPTAEPRGSPADEVRLRGRVLDALGDPIPDADVSTVLLGGAPRELQRGPRAAEPEPEETVRTTSDARGEFQLILQRAGLVRLSLGHEGYAPLGRRSLVFLGQELDLGALVLDPGVTLVGRVVDPGGAPLANAEVWQARADEGLTAGPSMEYVERVARTDAAGRFELRRQAVGEWRLEARASTFAPGTAAGTTELPGERVDGLVLALELGTTLRGHVAGLDASRLACVTVVARTDQGKAQDEPLLAPLDAQGAFEFHGLASGAELELVAVLQERGGHRPIAKPQRVHVGEDEVEIGVVEIHAQADALQGTWPERTLAAQRPNDSSEGEGGVLEVQVRSSDGLPAASALVAHRRVPGKDAAPSGPRGARASEIRATDRSGRLLWSGLESGTHEFRVVDSVFGLEEEGSTTWTTVEVASGELDPLVLAGVSSVELAGVVRVDGEPLVRAELLLQPARDSEPEPRPARSASGRRPGSQALLVRSDGEGRFRFPGLSAGAYRLELLHPERALPETRTITLAKAHEELVLDLGSARLRGVVRAPDGLSLAGARVRAFPAREERGRSFERRVVDEVAVVSGPDGVFELTGLEPERPLRLEVSLAGRATRVTGAALPEAFQEVVLDPEAILVLELVPNRESFLYLRARGPDGAGRALALTPGRSATLTGLSEGTWRLELQRGELRGGREENPVEQREVELTAGENRLRWVVP